MTTVWGGVYGWPLTPREAEVLQAFIDCDCDYPTVAARLVISVKTVRNHTQSIRNKLGAANMAAAVVAGIRCGAVNVNERGPDDRPRTSTPEAHVSAPGERPSGTATDAGPTPTTAAATRTPPAPPVIRQPTTTRKE